MDTTMTQQKALAFLQTLDQGQFLIQSLKDRREQAMRMMNDADDCELRKLAGACAVLTDILDDFEEARPRTDVG